MPSNRDMSARPEMTTGSAGGVWQFLGLGVRRSAHWAHPVAALFAFATDVVKPILPHCTVWVLVAALAVIACLLIVIRLKAITMEIGATLIAFCLMTALLSVAVIGLQKVVGGDDGAFARLIPGIEELQKKFGLVATKLDLIQQAQQQEAALAASRDAEVANRLNAMDATLRSIVETTAHEKGVPVEALVQILTRLGETTIS